MRATARDRQVFRHIADVESELRPPPACFADALAALERLLARHWAMFSRERPGLDDEEFRSHEALYERARTRRGHSDHR
jgi:hypothetical protein